MDLNELSVRYHSDKVGTAPLNPMFMEIIGPSGPLLATSVTLLVLPHRVKIIAINLDNKEA